MGAKCSSQAWQEVMDRAFMEFSKDEENVFLDDVLLSTDTYEEHVDLLNRVMEKFCEIGMSVQPSKCKLFQDQLIFLGHKVSQEGLAVDPKKVGSYQSIC